MAPTPSDSVPSARLTAALAERYRVERMLGQGGMATVYLAHDLRHERDVAIKVLHPDLGAALGAERFLSEIKTTAKLQHPHILPLLDSGAADGLLYYVMPLVTGETLRQRLERERQLPLDDAVLIAREVADALNYAHGLGVIHRDIKPENILLQGGHAMVADFGIALAVQEAGGQRMTQTGLSLGTPQYMSPEQAMGEKSVDARSDLYALGAVTYEMLAGEAPFTGPSVQAIVARLLTEQPRSITVQRKAVPLPVEAAVLRALEKLPADRWSSCEKFAEALLRQEGVNPSGAARAAEVDAAVRPSRRRFLSRIGMAGAIALAAAGGAWLAHTFAAPAAPWSVYTQLTDASGLETSPSLSPDGQSFVYASNARGTYDLYVQRVGGRTPLLITSDSTSDETWPSYSPDGTQIAFSRSSGGVFLVGATGESVRRLTTFGHHPSWSPDGKRIVFGGEEVLTPYAALGVGGLWTVSVTGGEPVRVPLSNAATTQSYQPVWSPSGAHIAFWGIRGGQRDLFIVPVEGGEVVQVTDDTALDWAPTWSPDGGSLYFASDRGGTMGLWCIAIDVATGRPTRTPEPVAAGVDVTIDLPHLSRDGTTLVFRSSLKSINPAVVPFDPVSGRVGSVTLLQQRSGQLVPSDVSPDGQWLALAPPEGREDIFLMRTDGTGLTRLTDDPARDRIPRFTPDGAAVTFYSNQRGQYDGWMMRLDGSGRTRLTDFADGTLYTSFAPDGKRLLRIAEEGLSVWVGTAPWPMTRASSTQLSGFELEEDKILLPTRWSPDGRRLSGYVVASSGRAFGVAVYDVAEARAYQLNDDARFASNAPWLPDSRHIVYVTTSGTLVVQDVVSRARREIRIAMPLGAKLARDLVVAPDGRSLYISAEQSESNIWMLRRDTLSDGR